MSPALRSPLSAAALALLLTYGAARYGVDLTELQIRWLNDLFWTATSLAAGLKGIQVFRNVEGESRAWLFFGLAHLSFFVGMLVWSFYELVLGQLNPFPSPADIGFLAAALFFVLGINAASIRSGRSFVRGFIVSRVGVIATGTLLLTAIWLIDAVVEAQTGGLYTAVALAWTVSFSTAFVYGCVTVWADRPASGGGALILVVTALGVHAFVGVLYTEALLRNSYEFGSWFDALWIIAFVLFWLGAIECERASRKATHERDAPGEDIERTGATGSFVISVAIALTFVALASKDATPKHLDSVLLVLGTLFAAATAWRNWEFYCASMEVAAERESLLARLREATATAEAANLAKAEFLSAMSHEIRTPLSGLLGTVDLLRWGPLTEKQRGHVDTARVSGRHLVNIINDILDFSRIEAGHLQLEHVNFSLPMVLERLRSVVHPLAAERSIDLHFHLSEHSSLVLKGDPTRLKQVLLNLVGNAIKFTEKGSVTLTISSEPTSDGRLRFRFKVRDTGIGIAPEMQGEIFDAFAQADRSITRRFGGSGLGLVISKRLVNAMGGEIGINSAPGLGSLFWVDLPFEIGDPAELEHGRRLQSAQVQPCRILVAEDVKLTQDILRDMLSRQGHVLVFAENGAEAVDLVQKEAFDLILMDMQMPVMDGIEATRRIRQLPSPAKDVPIVALTANVMASERDKCLTAGMDECLLKPVDWEQLQNAISRYGGNAQAEGSLASAVRQEDEAAPLVDQKRLEWFRVSMTGDELAYWISRSIEDAEESCRQLASLPKGSTEITRAAHSLKGAAGTFGFMRISQISARIEGEARQGGEAEPLIAELKDAVAATRGELLRSGLIAE